MAVGATETSSGLLVSSSSNDFENVVPGLQLTIKGQSTSTVTVSVENTSSDVVDNLKQFVANYNKLVDAVDDQTTYNATDGTSGLLFGSTEAL